MKNNPITMRRQLLKFLAASPILPYANLLLGAEGLMSDLDPDLEYLLSLTHDLVQSPNQALNVFDLEAVARNTLPAGHYGYIATGVSDERSQIANSAAYKNIQLNARRLVDISKIDISTELFGVSWPSPITIAPVGHQKAFHAEGEIAVARAARTRNLLMVLSTVTNTSIEDVNKARGEPVWYQLYAIGKHWPSTLSLIKRVEVVGCPVLVLTVDTPGSSKRESMRRFIQQDTQVCASCHSEDETAYVSNHPMYEGIDLTKRYSGGEQAFDWTLVDRIRDATRMKLVIKGIGNADDAKLCLKHGVDGIIVSNHGGRVGISGRATIDMLPGVVSAVDGKIPVMVDGGIRRGSDVFKALALGAKAVGIGRPYLWGLGAFGQPGVERVLDILNAEFTDVMRQMGALSLQQISSDSLIIK